MNYWWFVLLITLVSLLMTAALRKYALAKSIIDVPNDRSSHTVPTPRGGGVAIVFSFLAAIAVLTGTGLIDSNLMLGLAGSGGLIAIIGFMDDHGHVAARWRLLGHFAAAAWGLYWLGGVPQLIFFGYELNLGWAAGIAAAVYLVWMLNLYNFMDGIDGIASVEAVCVCLGACLVYTFSNHEALIALPLLLAAAVSGFLFWNFPPARIFMGDAGSGFLGIMLALLALQAAWAEPLLLWSWLILLGVFIVDSTTTLMRRLLRREKVYEAHRSHAYQFASRRFGSHLTVTAAVAAINALWLLPWALAVGVGVIDGTVGLLVAYTPLILLAFRFNAGAAE